MSRIAVLGDIHGNIDAFRGVLDDIKKESINQLLITGDLVGYYYHADEVLDALKGWRYELVQGNHDGMLSEFSTWGVDVKDTYRRKYGSALEHAAEELLSEKEISYLAELPHRKELHMGGLHILLCHGSPWNRDEYIYPDAPPEVLERCADDGYDVVIMGHTHYPMLKKVRSMILLNPGSVGQPRDGQCKASWAILDLNKLSVQFRKVSYSTERLLGEISKRDPGILYLRDILTNGTEKYVRT